MSEPLDQLLTDLSAIDRFLEVEAFIGRMSSKQLPDGFDALNSGGLDDREFSSLIRQGMGVAKSARTELPVVTGTLVLYLAGRFESFVKEKIEAAARDIGKKCGQFDKLPEKMRASLLNQTVEVMKSPRKFGHAEHGVRSFVKRLAAGYTSITETEPVNFECISITESNMRPDVFKDLCDRIGFTDAWGHLSTQSNMKIHFGSLDAATVSKEAQSKLKKLMDDRNSIAHPASTTTFPNTTTVSDYVVFIKMLCGEFEAVLDMYVSVVQPIELAKAPA